MAIRQQRITGTRSLPTRFHKFPPAVSFAYTERLTTSRAQAESISTAEADALPIITRSVGT